jgi:glycosyltransferase involved in cell wall biosynthesis
MYKVTVGVCCYQQKEWLYRCLRSLASQTFPRQDFEVVIVNDDPDEDLRDVCDSFETDGLLNLRLINNAQNLGLPASLNRILSAALGQYFVRVDADDYVSRHFLYILSLFLDMNREYQAVTCDYRKVDEVGRPVSTHRFLDDPLACGVMFTYESLCNLRFYNKDFKMREGHELLKRFTEKYKICHLPFSLYRYRIHENNRTKDHATIAEYDALLGADSIPRK